MDTLTMFDIFCPGCQCMREPEAFTFTANKGFALRNKFSVVPKKAPPAKKLKLDKKEKGVINPAARCNAHHRGEKPSEYAVAKSKYLCALWKIIKIPILFERELKNEDQRRKDKIYDTIMPAYKEWFARQGITVPTDEQMDAVLYHLLAEDVERDVQAELHRIQLRQQERSQAKEKADREHQEWLDWIDGKY